jgi:hypothetical protein
VICLVLSSAVVRTYGLHTGTCDLDCSRIDLRGCIERLGTENGYGNRATGTKIDAVPIIIGLDVNRDRNVVFCTDENDELVVYGRILALVRYLETLQVE